jgi:1-acyl-sn-glycerol-3-phosphate acyltransferase
MFLHIILTLCASVSLHYPQKCKAELFLIPYFSWQITAFGGVPINRGNRDQAVQAMEAAASAAKLGE